MSLSCLYRLDLYRIKLLIVELKELGKKKKILLGNKYVTVMKPKKLLKNNFFFNNLSITTMGNKRFELWFFT